LKVEVEDKFVEVVVVVEGADEGEFDVDVESVVEVFDVDEGVDLVEVFVVVVVGEVVRGVLVLGSHGGPL
jgi:hypothetical protein